MNWILALSLRLLLALGLTLSVTTQVVVLPWLSGEMATAFPEVSHLRWPILIGSIFAILCVEVVLVCTWNLVNAIQRNRIFDPHSFTWIAWVIRCLAALAALILALLVVDVINAIGPITIPAIIAIGLISTTGMLLLMITMKNLLMQVTSLQDEVDGVM
jgi:hypothetical protein